MLMTVEVLSSAPSSPPSSAEGLAPISRRWAVSAWARVEKAVEG
jgi:hypothetical protein